MPIFGGGLRALMQPPQAQMPNADPMNGLGVMQRLQYLRQNSPETLMALGAGVAQGNAAGGFADAGQYLARHRKEAGEQAEKTRTTTLTRNFIKKRNPQLSNEDIDAIIASGGAKDYVQPADATDDFKVVGDQIFNTSDQSWITPPGGGGTETGLVPQMMRNKKTGETIFVQPTKDGRLLPSDVPEGFEPYSPQEKAFATELGKGQGEQAVGLPGVASIAGQIDQQVQSLKDDPYLPNMLGPIQSRLPTITADGARVQGKIDQLKGGAFLQARQMLKGGGAITDYEGMKAEAAFARMSQAQNEGDFKAALDEFNLAVQQGLQKLQANSGGQEQGPMRNGGVVDYKDFF